jgi:TetR/AcrR family transcriptional regulator, transcriptional repressor for nem operon
MMDAGSRHSPSQAIAVLALLSGGVSMARAVDDPRLAEEIAAAVRIAARDVAKIA